MKRSARLGLGAVLGFAVGCGSQSDVLSEPLGETSQPVRGCDDDQLEPHKNPDGKAQTVSETGGIDPNNEFFASMGTNGRTCNSCHIAEEGWSISPKGLQERFKKTGGLDPVFRPHDGANSPNADVSTVAARRAAYSMLLTRGVIRLGLPVRDTHEFKVVAVDDPYGFIQNPPSGPQPAAFPLSLFRRPLPTTNLKFVTVVNWDGRSSLPADLTNTFQSMKNQSNGATVNHALAPAPIADDIRTRIAGFESGIYTAQTQTDGVGHTDKHGARGGPEALSQQPFTWGANDPTSPGFTRKVFTIFDAWNDDGGGRGDVAEGQRIFNEKTFAGGRTCSGCHSLPNVGSSSGFRFFDVGISAASRRARDMPLYTLENKTTGERIQTTDPGRALISGQWADINRFKAPSLRGLASHAPYFHDGSAKDVEAVVDHYEEHFQIDFTRREKKNLIKFLASL